MVEKMKLTGNQIMYLLTIKNLAAEKHVIKSVDVARDMNYSRASVHKMLRSLKNLKYQVIEDALKDTIDLPEGYQLGICNLIELM